jgi:hypothetical protein
VKTNVYNISVELEAVCSELNYSLDRISFAGQGDRRNSAWVRALENLKKALECLADQPYSELLQLRVTAAEREANRVAESASWRIIGGIVDGLRGPDWVRFIEADKTDTNVCLDDMFVSWAQRNPGKKIVLSDGGWDGFNIFGGAVGDRIHVWSRVHSWRHNKTRFVDVTISLDGLDGWEPLSVPGAPKRDLALLGLLDAKQLIGLTRTDPVAAIAAPNTTPDVLAAAGARVDVDKHTGRVTVVLPNRRQIVAGFVNDNMNASLRDQVRDLLPTQNIAVLFS